MNYTEANRTVSGFNRNFNPTENDIFEAEEAMQYMLQYYSTVDKDSLNLSVVLFNLASHYFDLELYDLAFKYYTYASEQGDTVSFAMLGDFYYYGLIGEVDYQKAFEYYSRAKGILHAKVKIADMYRYGQYVEKDLEQYAKIIMSQMDLYDGNFDMCPEIVLRAAELFQTRNKLRKESYQLYQIAKEGFVNRLYRKADRELIDEMKRTVTGIYCFHYFDEQHFDLYDLLIFMEQLDTVSFSYQNKKYVLESVSEEGHMIVRFEDQWFRSIEEFMIKGTIDHKRIITLYRKLKDFRKE